jgi:tetratricopeptide (TPR) repeat protein
LNEPAQTTHPFSRDFAVRRQVVILIGLWAPIAVSVCLAEPDKKPVEAIPAAVPTESRSAAPAVVPPAAIDLDEPAEPFVPARPRGEEQADRIEAVSLFAAGRIDEQEDRLYQALRRYQRASRFDPSSQAARRQAVVLAIRLERWNEALRYAARGDLGIDEAGVLWELARHFNQEEKYVEALAYFRAARSLQPEKKSTGYVILSLDVGRMAYLTRDFAAAADAFAEVMAALEQPDQYGLDERLYKRLLTGKEGTTSLSQLYLLFAEAFLSAERFDQGLAALDKANRISPNAAAHAYRLARLEDLRKQPAKALETLQPYFKANETSEGLSPYQLLVKLLNDLGRGAEILPTLEQLRENDGENHLLALFIADQYRQAEQFDKAEPLYAAVTAQSPSSMAYQGLAECRRRLKKTGALLDLLGEVAGKTDELKVLGEQTKSIAADAEMVAALFQLARDRHKADPDSVGFGARLALGLLALEAERFDEATEFFERAMKVNHESAKVIYQTWGFGLSTHGHYEEGAAILRRGIDQRVVATDDPTFHFLLSAPLALSGKIDEALAAAQHAASLSPRAPRVAGRVAWVLYYAKRYDEAAAAYRELVRRFDEEDLSDVGRQELHHARMILSNIAVIQHDMPASEEWLGQILDEFPDDVGAQNDLGYLWADQSKHLKMALSMIERAVAAEPENAAYRDSLGWILYRLGRHVEAVAELEKAAVGDSPDGVMLEHLGDACLAAGQQQAAGDAWRKAKAAFEKEGDAEKLARIKQKLTR